jgi:hypothetical protein
MNLWICAAMRFRQPSKKLWNSTIAAVNYLNRQFASAMAEFGKVLERDRSNKAASLHLSRCQHFLQKPPGDEWDGVWSLTEKS